MSARNGERCEVVVLVASAGGLGALTSVLAALPARPQAAVIVGLHLGGQGSYLVEILRRRAPQEVRWAVDGEPLEAGRVTVCPARSMLEIMPDRRCALRPLERSPADRPLDVLLESVADTFGAQALAVVMTGMGSDGTAGARAVKAAGGVVLAQSEETSEHPGMPGAVVTAGAADLVLPLYEIGPVIGGVMEGRSLPRPRSEIAAVEAVFGGPGEVAALAHEIDWGATQLGPVADWPALLRTSVRRALDAPLPVCLLWGPDHVQIYNDPYRALMGDKHPGGLAQTNRECWPEVWHLNEPLYASVWAGEPAVLTDALYPITRHGALEDAWFNLAYVPLRDDGGEVRGIEATVVERTGAVLAARRLRRLHALATESSPATTRLAAFRAALHALAGDGEDVPFAVGYLRAVGKRALLADAVGVDPGGPMAPRSTTMTTDSVWPLRAASGEAAGMIVEHLDDRFRGVLVGARRVPPQRALVAPLYETGDDRVLGLIVLGLNPRLRLDDAYREFLRLAVRGTADRVADAHGRERERERLDRMADLDREKTEFFSNVSHEFRTPLTLMLAPLQELRRRAGELPAGADAELELIERNARRLLRLVGTLLDFSRIEAGRAEASFEPTDLAERTRDIVSVFRSAAERAGLVLRVDVEPLAEPVWVDRQMWEKIVSNLVSNALKFTFAGEITVALRARPKHAELVVRDTGVGIPAEELPHLFKRFHRVRGARARTHEGAGIGLALVHELVRAHHGRVRVTSAEGEGTAFTVWLPLGRRAGVQPGGSSAGEGAVAPRWPRRPAAATVTVRASPRPISRTRAAGRSRRAQPTPESSSPTTTRTCAST